MSIVQTRTVLILGSIDPAAKQIIWYITYELLLTCLSLIYEQIHFIG